MATVTINLSAIINSAIALSRENKEWSDEDILSAVLKQIPVEDLSAAFARPSVETEAPKKEKKTRSRAGPSKPRALPDDEIRCCARAFYESEHLENGKLKIMREDTANLYGDRCKFKKSGESDFCKHHSEKQPLGIWGGIYADKFKKYVEKTESSADSDSEHEQEVESEHEAEVEAEKPVEKPASPKKIGAIPVPIPLMESEDEAEEEVIVKPAKKSTKKAAEKTEEKIEKAEKKSSSTKKTEKKAEKKVEKKPEPEEEELEVEEITIEGTDYLIDPENNVYDVETSETVGIYNRKTKKWVEKY